MNSSGSTCRTGAESAPVYCQAATWLHVGRRTIFKAIAGRELRAAHVNDRKDFRIHRSWLLAWGARVGLRVSEGWLTPADLAAADEAFLSSSVAGVLPVTAFAVRLPYPA